jgi:hypothetical protein
MLENVLSGWAIVSFSRRNQIHGVCWLVTLSVNYIATFPWSLGLMIGSTDTHLHSSGLQTIIALSLFYTRSCWIRRYHLYCNTLFLPISDSLSVWFLNANIILNILVNLWTALGSLCKIFFCNYLNVTEDGHRWPKHVGHCRSLLN